MILCYCVYQTYRPIGTATHRYPRLWLVSLQRTRLSSGTLRHVFSRAIISLLTEATNTPETSVNFYQTTGCHILEDSLLHTRRRQNLKSHLNYLPRVWIRDRDMKNWPTAQSLSTASCIIPLTVSMWLHPQDANDTAGLNCITSNVATHGALLHARGCVSDGQHHPLSLQGQWNRPVPSCYRKLFAMQSHRPRRNADPTCRPNYAVCSAVLISVLNGRSLIQSRLMQFGTDAVFCFTGDNVSQIFYTLGA
jgi:hypothetical protein